MQAFILAALARLVAAINALDVKYAPALRSVTLVFPNNTYGVEASFVDPAVTPGSMIVLAFATVAPDQENGPDCLDDCTPYAIPSVGVVTIGISSTTPQNGPVQLAYEVRK